MIAALIHGLVAAVVLASEANTVPDAVSDAVREATPPGRRAEVMQYRPTLPARCSIARAELQRGVASSGTQAVKLFGNVEQPQCNGWAWIQLSVRARVLVTTRTIQAGEPLANATLPVERELLQGQFPLTSVSENAVASRFLPAGVMIEERHARAVGPTPGDPVVVVAKAGSLFVEQKARVVPCTHGRACAILSSGKRVEGVLADGRIIVEVP